MASFISFHQLTKEKPMFNCFIENYSVKFVILPRTTEYVLVVFLYFSCFFNNIFTMLLWFFFIVATFFMASTIYYIYVFCHWHKNIPWKHIAGLSISFIQGSYKSEGLFWQLILKLKNTLENFIYPVLVHPVHSH